MAGNELQANFGVLGLDVGADAGDGVASWPSYHGGLCCQDAQKNSFRLL